MKEEWRNFFLRHDFEPLAHYFALHMLKLAFPEEYKADEAAVKALYLASGLVSYEASRANVCLNLQDYAGQWLPVNPDAAKGIGVRIPAYGEWLAALLSIKIIGRPGTTAPLIMENEGETARLYLYRYWQYEQRLADLIRQRLQPQKIDEELLQVGLARLYPEAIDGAPDQQKKAAETALRSRFAVVSGGPGTGKTTTVLKILALLIEQAGMLDFHVQLAAPTGKAAARLKESIMAGKRKLLADGLISRKIHDRIPEETATIHRLLGTVVHSVYFRHDSESPLFLDCLIVDEASMVDLALMAKLLAAVPGHAKVILLGDMDQLASVEAGAVFADICDAYRMPESPLGQCITKLKKSYRFKADRGIGRLSRLINDGKAQEAWDLVQHAPDRQIAWKSLPAVHEMQQRIRRNLLQHFRDYVAAPDINTAFKRLKSFAILCAMRQGPYGAVLVNRLIEAILAEAKLIPDNEEWYPCRPIMISRNDYQLRLFNGDIGIMFIDPADMRQKVFFETTEPGNFRQILPVRLPQHETIFAMTIHKSQGSEFDSTLLLLPDNENEILTRELLYTGLTRPRRHAEIWATETVFKQTVRNACRRNSGLAAKLLAPAQQ